MTTKTKPRGPEARAIAALMREMQVDARGLDRLCGVPADSIRNLLKGKTTTMTEGNLARIAATASGVLGRAITVGLLRAGKIR